MELRMEGTPSQVAIENKPSLLHGSQKEAGSWGLMGMDGVCVCVTILTKQI